MTRDIIVGKLPRFSASAILDAIACDLAAIKREDRLTYADLGALLGKSEDQAAKYCEGSAEMGIVSFSRAWREWGGRAVGSVQRLCEANRVSVLDDRECESTVLKAVLALSVALGDGNGITPEEVRQNRATLEAARDCINAQLAKLRPAA